MMSSSTTAPSSSAIVEEIKDQRTQKVL